MKRLALLLGGVALVATSAGAASAQSVIDQIFGGYGRGGVQPSGVILFEGPNFQGRSVQVYGEERNFSSINFNDRARSLITDRAISICRDSEFRNCRDIGPGRYTDLDRLGFGAVISSVRPAYGYGGGYDGGYGGGYDGGYGDDYGGGYDRPGNGYGRPNRDGVEGRTAVFFPRPSIQGRQLAARGQQSADQFCRASGYGQAIYYSQGERVRSAIDVDGRQVDAPALRDVLCRR